ncbi:redox-regulated ATPase YchF [Enterobacteriaceae endosymbiont of Donacia tomentosa]|uniref:redox-regulated ATPase YchF n=1 Tax=Enterobacteriaceae endosymbiont of Donacia tomentosa TaxID=2675787 RepID=UPI0014492277|nr:redox-regulated ATPase YchF [Enterobacteriaceae endosymbiont of Donacia tomentosa]QJC31554.1 redox-regulated ATPase YchF [Enterobacteriaceae endosymbiont of Donacia tomentosa]
MSLKCGIIGLPNVGKSTLFNILTNSNIDALNYPFCTIKPNISIVPIPDERLFILNKLGKSKKIIQSIITFVDIAGLIKGASKGEGLGNQFLYNIAEVDAIIHVVRAFYDKKILNLSFNPIKDVDIINNELIQFDINLLNKLINTLSKKSNKNLKNWGYLFFICLKHLKNGKLLNNLSFNLTELKFLKNLKLLTIKPMMIITNINENISSNDIFVKEIDLLSRKYLVIKICVKSILNNNQLLDQNNYLKKIIISSFNLLNLHVFYTVGKKETRSWSISKGTKALDAAKKIHSDIYRGFIRAKIIHYKDYIFYKSEIKAKLAGKVQIEGKEYIVQDGDIVNFLFKI